MNKHDREAMAAGIPSLTLMETAAKGIVEAVKARIRPGDTVTVTKSTTVTAPVSDSFFCVP